MRNTRGPLIVSLLFFFEPFPLLALSVRLVFPAEGCPKQRKRQQRAIICEY